MSQYEWYSFVGGILFIIGFYGLITRSHIMRMVIAINVMGTGVFLIYVALAMRSEGHLTQCPTQWY